MEEEKVYGNDGPRRTGILCSEVRGHQLLDDAPVTLMSRKC